MSCTLVFTLGLSNFLKHVITMMSFLFSPKGDLVYSVFKENDFATNMYTGEWKNTDLAAVFTSAVREPSNGSIAFKDFAPYAPSNNVPASFISTPIIENGALRGVLVFQMPIARLNGIMQSTAGMGESGETYLVGMGPPDEK